MFLSLALNCPVHHWLLLFCDFDFSLIFLALCSWWFWSTAWLNGKFWKFLSHYVFQYFVYLIPFLFFENKRNYVMLRLLVFQLSDIFPAIFYHICFKILLKCQYSLILFCKISHLWHLWIDWIKNPFLIFLY